MIDTKRWQKIIKQPDWYIVLYPEIKKYQKMWEENPDNKEAKESKAQIRDFFEMALETNSIALGKSGQNLDAEREPIDTIVIHHTSSEPGYTLPHMNAVQLINVYIPYFNNPTGPGEVKLKGQPMWSNHVRGGRPVFYLYHWLMRMDGSFVRLLEDHELGWHAANWDINKRSIGICLDNTYEAKDPEPHVLEALARFIATNYPHINTGTIFGHSEVSMKEKKTTCPGSNFVNGWKQDLLKLVKQAK